MRREASAAVRLSERKKMRKLVITKKKKIKVRKLRSTFWKAAKQAAAIAMAVGLAGNALTAFAAEGAALPSGKETVAYVYHRHIGNEKEEGGC